MRRTYSFNSLSPRRRVQLGIDVPLLLATIILLVFGALMVYSASFDFSLLIFEDATYIFSRQMTFLAVGALIAVVLVFLDYHIWKRLAVIAILVTIAALILVLLVGEERFGSVRGLSGGSYQPSELAKLVIVIYLSVWLNAKQDFLKDVRFGLVPLGMILGIVGGLIFLQPDLSAVITVMALGGLMFFLAGGEMRQIILLVLLALLMIWVVVRFSPTGRARVEGYLNGLRNPMDAPYHVRRSLEAFVKGGLTGAGIGKAETKLTGLPVPHSDSIYSVVGEETGVLGASLLVVLYGVILWRGLLIASRAPDMLGALLTAGLSIWIVMEAYINMLVVLGLLPFAGNALPFISAGGSSLLVVMASIGIILNVSRLASREEQQAQRKFSDVVDFRGRRPRQVVVD